MKLYTVKIAGDRQLAAESGGSLYLLRDLGVTYKDMNELILHASDAELEKLKAELLRGDALDQLRAYSFDEVHLCAPIPNPMQDIVCLGVNYDAHIREVGEKPHQDTVYFSKRANEASGAFDPIPSYSGYVDSLDYEVELAVVIGKQAKAVSAGEALSCVFGYTILNDVSARNIQFKHQQWYLGKSLDGFCPMGPCIVTADELPDVQNLALSCRVNGELRQSSSTSDMIQTVAGAISELSQAMVLKAGTIIATGTPGGVALGMKPPVFLKPGDEVVCEIEGIGMLKNIVE